MGESINVSIQENLGHKRHIALVVTMGLRLCERGPYTIILHVKKTEKVRLGNYLIYGR